MSTEAALPPLGVRQRGPVVSGTRCILIRHGESTANALGVAGGLVGDRGLTELGRLQARALMARLVQSGEFREVSHIYYSTMPRARETAAIVRDAYTHELELLEHPNIDELRVGDGDGLTWAEFAERFDVPDWDVDPHLPNAPRGESRLGFYERATTALTEISLRHPEGTVFVVCHGGFIEQATKWVLGLDPGTRMQQRIEHCSLTEIEVRPGSLRLLRFNDQTPLPEL